MRKKILLNLILQNIGKLSLRLQIIFITISSLKEVTSLLI